MPVEERWITKEDMAEEIKKAKVNRKNRLSAFARKQRHLKKLLEGETEGDVISNLYEELSNAFKEVETAHEKLCLLLEEDDEDAADTFLDNPSDELASLHVEVSKAISKAKEDTATAKTIAEKERSL